MVMDPLAGQAVKSLLLVDDDPGVLASLRQLFEADYKIYTAENSRDGVRLFQEMHPDVVCLDLRLPDENGLETLREIKEKNAKAYVVILTGYSTPFARHESSCLGATEFLSKPFDSNYLKKRVDEILFTDQDVTLEDKNQSLYQKPSKSSDRLKEIDFASSGFLHDIASPLSAISLLSGLLAKKFSKTNNPNGSGEEAKIADLLKLNSEYMCALVEQWRAFAEPDNLMRHQVDVREIVEHTCFLVQEKLKAKGVELSVQMGVDKKVLYVNRFALSRVLANLVMNAIEAVEESNGKVEIQVFIKERFVSFVVRDNGPGIRAEVIDQIFEPRYSTKDNGLGMGLFISKRIVEACHGEISAELRKQGGTEFTIRIPFTS
jgi:signal transduction histidine kinase